MTSWGSKLVLPRVLLNCPWFKAAQVPFFLVLRARSPYRRSEGGGESSGCGPYGPAGTGRSLIFLRLPHRKHVASFIRCCKEEKVVASQTGS